MLTDEELGEIANFGGKNPDGHYCDGADFIITPFNKQRTKWDFRLFSEVDGSSWHVKYIDDIEDLKNLYNAITNKDLVFYKYVATDGSKYAEDRKEEYLYHQRELDGEIKTCEHCIGFGWRQKKVTKPQTFSKSKEGIKHVTKIRVECPECKGVGYFELKKF